MAEAPTSSALRKTKSSPPPGEDAEMAVAKKVKFATEDEKKEEKKEEEEEPVVTATHAGIKICEVGCGVFGGLKRKAFIALLDENPKEFRRRFPDLPARHYDNDDEHPCHGLCCEWEPNDDGLCDSCGFDVEEGEEEAEGEPDWDAVAEQLGPSWCPDCREGVKLNGACSWCYRVLSRDPATGRLRCEREVLDERDLLDQH